MTLTELQGLYPGKIHDFHGPGLTCWCGRGSRRYKLVAVPWAPDRFWYCPYCEKIVLVPGSAASPLCGCTEQGTFMVPHFGQVG